MVLHFNANNSTVAKRWVGQIALLVGSLSDAVPICFFSCVDSAQVHQTFEVGNDFGEAVGLPTEVGPEPEVGILVSFPEFEDDPQDEGSNRLLMCQSDFFGGCYGLC